MGIANLAEKKGRWLERFRDYRAARRHAETSAE
jgi:hypothetical protein